MPAMIRYLDHWATAALTLVSKIHSQKKPFFKRATYGFFSSKTLDRGYGSGCTSIQPLLKGKVPESAEQWTLDDTSKKGLREQPHPGVDHF
ncbi:hypothetical protein TNCV_15971 [Trichonephila clavipes]|nr:hypothetical protein TNCV_15971 [Trichonephila clavipes]